MNIRKTFIENKNVVIMLIIPIAIVAKLIEHILLPEKYFYDSNRILITSLEGMVEGYSWAGNYEFTANIFAKLNILDFTTLLQWSVMIGSLFNLFVICIFIKIKGLDMMQSIFVFMCVGLCNIYVFNIGKDIIQFFLFLLCFAIISIDRIPILIRTIGVALIFYWESTFFRNYYIIMAAFTIGVFFILKIIKDKHIKINIKTIILVLGILYGMMYFFLNIAKYFMPDEWNDILTCKSGTEVMVASSMIYDKIDFGTNINLYMLNYVINSIRMMFPYELLSGGVFYLPFFAFQVLLIYYIYRNIKKIYIIDNKNILALSTFIAFFMGSVLFEPDFGSFARHEAAAFPIIILFAIDNLHIIKGKVYENSGDNKVTFYGKETFN